MKDCENLGERVSGQRWEPPTISSEKAMKLILATWIVVSHLPKPEPLGQFNYFPVAGFFFLSGYGLMRQKELGIKFRLVKSGLKLLIPFFICEGVYVALFVAPVSPVRLSDVVRMIGLRSIMLPYGWYVYTQFVCYLIWAVVSRIRKPYLVVILTFICLFCYAYYQRSSSEFLTSYKTVFSFVYGVAFSAVENRERISKIFRNLYLPIANAVLACYIFNFLIDNESVSAAVLYNLSALLFCNVMIWIFYNIDLARCGSIKLAASSYEIYLVQGIAQCFYMQTYFCKTSILNLSESLWLNILSILTTILAGVLLNKLLTPARRAIGKVDC